MPRVLVVDDEEVIRQIISEALEFDGFEVEGARDGQSALAVLERWCPDAIVLDLMMPGMSGPQFMAELAARGEDGIPVIVVSGHSGAESVGAWIGAAATIRKPFDLDVLLLTVQRLTGPAAAQPPAWPAARRGNRGAGSLAARALR